MDSIYRQVILSYSNYFNNNKKNYFNKVLHRLNMQNAKPVSKVYLETNDENDKMSKVPQSSVVASLMYVIVCFRPDLSHALSVVFRFMAISEKRLGKPSNGSFATFKVILIHVWSLENQYLGYMETLIMIIYAISTRKLLKKVHLILKKKVTTLSPRESPESGVKALDSSTYCVCSHQPYYFWCLLI